MTRAGRSLSPRRANDRAVASLFPTLRGPPATPRPSALQPPRGAASQLGSRDPPSAATNALSRPARPLRWHLSGFCRSCGWPCFSSVHSAAYLPIFPSTGVPIEAANTSTTNAPKQGTKPVVLASKSFHLLQRLTTTQGLFGPVRAVAADFFGLGHDLLFWTQSNRPSWMRQERSRPAARRKLFRCALRIPLPRQAVVPLRQRLSLALGSSLRPMSVPAVCPDSLATKFNKEKHHVQLQKQRPSRRQPRQKRRKENHPKR